MKEVVSMRFACAVLFLVLTQSANAQQDAPKITLACNGTSRSTATTELKLDPVTNIYIDVNVADQTVSFLDNQIPITTTTLLFVGFSSPHAGGNPIISGRIDRITRSVEIDWKYDDVSNDTHWELACRPYPIRLN
ncbi:hypothetical protein ACFQZO_05940 [Bradyrhizobium sp. GCM10027634]|uniref:hypothetical protein n=1 Tax=unclassified Bradyrhizobium TaxID=2631580 RepID=UPI00188D2FC3|nr:MULTISPECIES: hypothetical protein [unclassified Bradyrhizobium]MDN5000418.1 hypothetical protein [Bradyrhizobium sp. WYCCWR 12677]QOZ42825.1 hypothetical protein XH89_04585 [Bradyrhizobium sp. CCBAU 53340]